MKFSEIKVNSYGKLKNKQIKFEDGINVIYGDNEAGKSTLLNFLVNMLYGSSKNKKGKVYSDFDKYKPWDSDEFSGKINYKLDNGEQFEIFREFSKKNPKIYNKNMEEVSKKYSIDKSSGSQFFFEQTGVDENVFTSTLVSFQNEVELDNQTQNVLLQKIANTSSTGEDRVSYKKAIEKLNKKQLEEIGTNRSQGKPINIVEKELRNIEIENRELSNYNNYKFEVEDKINTLQEEEKKLKKQLEFCQGVNQLEQVRELELEKIKYNENRIDSIEQEIQKLEQQKQKLNSTNIKSQEFESKKVRKLPLIIAVMCLLASVVIFCALKQLTVAIISVIIGILSLVYFVFDLKKCNKINKENNKNHSLALENSRKIEKQAYELDAQIDLLEKSQKKQIDETEQLKNETLKNIENKIIETKKRYSTVLPEESLSWLLESNNIPGKILSLQGELNNTSIELHKTELDKQNIMPKLDKLAQNDEKIEYYKSELEQLQKKSQAIALTKKIIEDAHIKMRDNVTPRFVQDLSTNFSKITSKKYNNIAINENEGILIEQSNGEYKNANRMSLGTIQQLYMAFRLALIENISNEKMPIIFDEIFAYYDDSRMKEALLNIYNNYANNHQIVFFTCTERELKILDEMNIHYNKIIL